MDSDTTSLAGISSQKLPSPCLLSSAITGLGASADPPYCLFVTVIFSGVPEKKKTVQMPPTTTEAEAKKVNFSASGTPKGATTRNKIRKTQKNNTFE
ncbi:hypothetical protein PsorP6_011461 [Peronosclerospora sorghi]|uniref:Uncharacterized protein n=1 Tax=Peronosclerospora sorghi TaxID=230839 RepID=A0ACC0WIB3_9STRA|nr:hypothetical protein PsorP6_011461 [Peronosclerospora sorghi]